LNLCCEANKSDLKSSFVEISNLHDTT
jgi:hypothetical protein